MYPRRILVPVFVLAMLAMLTGCSGAPSTSALSQSDASATFPCSMFSLTDIKAATGYNVVVAEPIATSGNSITIRSCEFVDAKKHAFGVTSRKGGAAFALKLSSEIAGTGGPVTGIGDSSIGNQSELGVVFGDDYVEVAHDSDANDDSVTLANVGLDRLK